MATAIANRALKVSLADDGATFAVEQMAGDGRFACTVSLPEPAVSVQTGSTTNEAWGKGQVLRLGFASGSTASLTLYERLPFVAVQMGLHNAGRAVQVVDRHSMVSVAIRSAAPVEPLRAFGTFGLSVIEASGNPGSYAHLAIVDPATRAGALCAWLTHDRGSGVFFTERRDETVAVEARLDYGRLQIEPGQSTELETLLVGAFDDVRLGLEAYADAVAAHYGIELPRQPAVYCTWYHAGASDEARLARNTEFAAAHLKPYGFSVVQIDDGWQLGQSANGPKKNFTGHNPDGPYPHGMAATAEHIRSHGLVPGLWLMPFAGTADDPFFADKQHFFATRDATPFEVHWGGTCFDMTHPDTRAYVRATVARICGEWGYGYIKIDGLWTGAATDICYINTEYKDDRLGETRLHDPAKTHIEAYRDGLAAVRDGAGDDTFILGCCVAQNLRTLGASFGLVDAMRVGPDNGVKWEAMTRGPFSGSNLYFLHGRVWYNDPDPLYVRPSVPLEQARALASWVALSGQLNASSCDFAELPPERVDILKRTMPSHTLRPRPVDLFEQRIPRIWRLADEEATPPRYVVGLFNWSDAEPARLEEALARIGLPEAAAYEAFDFWEDEFIDPIAHTLKTTVPPASCRILALRAASSHPQVVSTSRHVTQGIVDLCDEAWDEAAQTLRGTSQLVGGDAYELRIVAGTSEEPWQVASVQTSDPTVAASWCQEGRHARVRLEGEAGGEVAWEVCFGDSAG